MIVVIFDAFLRRYRSVPDFGHLVICPLCGMPWVGMVRHLGVHHGLSHEQTVKVLAFAERGGR